MPPRSSYLGVLVALASLPGVVRADDPPLQGFGAATKGGSEGPPVAVTTLADSGAGSLREALAAGKRQVVFKVSGTIKLKSALTLAQPDITVDGSTAPAPGITVVGKPFVIRDTHDVIVRHLRFRESDDDNIRISGEARGIVIDHCSSTRAGDGAIDITLDYKTQKKPRDITISWCLLGGTQKAMLVQAVSNLSLHHNLFTSCDQRNPQLHDVTNFDLRNNVIRYWGSYGIRLRAGSSGNVVDCVFGPSSNPRKQPSAALVLEADAGAVHVAGCEAPAGFDANKLSKGNAAKAPKIDTVPTAQVVDAVTKGAGAQPIDKVDQEFLKDAGQIKFRPATTK